jgi:hypothetical protein
VAVFPIPSVLLSTNAIHFTNHSFTACQMTILRAKPNLRFELFFITNIPLQPVIFLLSAFTITAANLVAILVFFALFFSCSWFPGSSSSSVIQTNTHESDPTTKQTKHQLPSFPFCIFLMAVTMSRSLKDVTSRTEQTASGRYALLLQFKSERLVLGANTSTLTISAQNHCFVLRLQCIQSTDIQWTRIDFNCFKTCVASINNNFRPLAGGIQVGSRGSFAALYLDNQWKLGSSKLFACSLDV